MLKRTLSRLLKFRGRSAKGEGITLTPAHDCKKRGCMISPSVEFLGISPAPKKVKAVRLKGSDITLRQQNPAQGEK